MKKAVVLLLLLLFAVQASAVGSNLKDEYEKRETAIVEMSGAILANMPKDNVEILRDGHIQTAFEGEVKKLGSKHYIWFIAPQNEGNYTLAVRDILTSEGGTQKLTDYEKSFRVLQNDTDYSIKPGVVFASSDFSVTATLFSETEKAISVSFPDSRNIVLEQGINKIDFSVKNVVGTQMININFGKYTLPAYIAGKAANNTNLNNQTEESNDVNNSGNANIDNIIYGEISFRISPRVIKSTIFVTEEKNFPFNVINSGNFSVYNLTLDYNRELFAVDPDKIDFIGANSSFQLNVTIKNNTQGIRDAIIISDGNSSDYLIVDLEYTQNESEASTSYLNGSSQNSLLYCSEIPGAKMCTSANEICDGQKVSSLDSGVCCIGTCEEAKEKSRAWIGYLVIAAAILILLLIYLKYKKTKPHLAQLGTPEDVPKLDMTRVETKRP